MTSPSPIFTRKFTQSVVVGQNFPISYGRTVNIRGWRAQGVLSWLWHHNSADMHLETHLHKKLWDRLESGFNGIHRKKYKICSGSSHCPSLFCVRSYGPLLREPVCHGGPNEGANNPTTSTQPSSQEWDIRFSSIIKCSAVHADRLAYKQKIEIKYAYQWPSIDHSPVMKSAWSDAR
jgi:hypothetical protein